MGSKSSCLLNFCLLAILLASALFAGAYYRFKPYYGGVVKLTRNIGEATVHREHNGIPHIYGDNEEISYFALGYVNA